VFHFATILHQEDEKADKNLEMVRTIRSADASAHKQAPQDMQMPASETITQ
jgi:hypothetical protein